METFYEVMLMIFTILSILCFMSLVHTILIWRSKRMKDRLKYEDTLERCVECGELTGKNMIGFHEENEEEEIDMDSLFFADEGPYCEACYQKKCVGKGAKI